MAQDGGDLPEAIASLRAGLEAALAEGRGKDVQFGLGEVELTLQLVADKHAGGDLLRAFQTADYWLIHAADCRSTYSSWACCGLRY
jgi:hypothetical protein